MQVSERLVPVSDAATINARRLITGETALHYAAAQGLTKTCALISKRSDFVMLHARGLDGMTTLHYAACFGQEDTCQVLLGARANANVKDAHGRTCFDVAHSCGFRCVLSCLQRERVM